MLCNRTDLVYSAPSKQQISTCRWLSLQLQSSIHAYDASNEIPVIVGADPICYNNACASGPDLEFIGTLTIFTMTNAEIFNDGWIHLGGNSLGPAGGVEEVASAQEVDEEGGQRSVGLEVRHACNVEILLASTFQLAAGEVNLLLDVIALGDFVKILNTDVTAADGAVLAVIGPALGVNGPSPTVPACLPHVIVEGKATDDDDAATGRAESWNLRLRPPAVSLLVDVAVFQVLAQVLVGALAGSLALDAHEYGLARVLVEEAVDVFEHVGKGLGASEANGECTVDEGQAIVIGTNRHADIKEANAIAKLFGDAHRLAAHRGQSLVTGRRIVSAGDREQRKRPVVVEFLHPCVELSRGEDCEHRPSGHINDSQVVRPVAELLHDG